MQIMLFLIDLSLYFGKNSTINGDRNQWNLQSMKKFLFASKWINFNAKNEIAGTLVLKILMSALNWRFFTVKQMRMTFTNRNIQNYKRNST